jgi:translation initiation factor 1
MGRKGGKNKTGVVYSTNSDFNYDYDEEEEQKTLLPGEQRLKVYHDRKQRKGKTATIVEGFEGTSDDLKHLSKSLKTLCGTGGSAKDGLIIIQGEVRDRVYDWLIKEGYKAKKSGG